MFVCLILNVPVNSCGHVETVSSINHTFVVDLLLIGVPIVGFYVCSKFCCVLCSFEIISMEKRELVEELVE